MAIAVQYHNAHSIQEDSMKTAIIILSDPKSGSEEALGRVFNALAG